jgi:hypothetical protein
MGVVVEDEPFWLDEKAGTNHSAVSTILFKFLRYKSDISIIFYCNSLLANSVSRKQTYRMTHMMMVIQLCVTENTERSKIENESLRDDRGDRRLTVQ